MTVDMDTKTITLVSNKAAVISNTGLVDLATSLIADNSIKVQTADGVKSVNIPEDATLSDYVASLKLFCPPALAAA